MALTGALTQDTRQGGGQVTPPALRDLTFPALTHTQSFMLRAAVAAALRMTPTGVLPAASHRCTAARATASPWRDALRWSSLAVGRRPASTQAPAGDGRTRMRFAVHGAGCSVRVVTVGGNVDVTVGEPDAIEVLEQLGQGRRWGASGGAAPSRPCPTTPATPSPPTTSRSLQVAWLPPAGGAQASVSAVQTANHVDVTAPAGATAGALEVAIPRRYAAVDVHTGGGGVRVDRVTEAALDLVTEGGNAVVGSARCTSAAVHTGGGSLAGGALSADALAIATSGGDVELAKVVARAGTIASGGGCVDIGAAYGDVLDVDSGGGRVSIAQLNARGLATVRTGGGAASLAGVDGGADVDTGGGPAAVHVLAGARAVRASSRGGPLDARAVREVLGVHGAPVPADALVLGGGQGGADAAGAELEARWEQAKQDLIGSGEVPSDAAGGGGLVPTPPPPPPLAPAAPPPAGIGRLRPGASTDTLVLLDARPGGSAQVAEASWFDAAAARARTAVRGRAVL